MENTLDNNLVSRQAVDELSKELVHTTKDKADFLCNFWEGLQKLPSVTPKEKTGRWIDSKDWKEKHYDFINFRKHCSLCNGTGNAHDKFCSNCGARMQEVENDT